MGQEFIFHIGTEKTGTTSLQLFFEENEDKLKKQGFFYSATSGRRQNWKLPYLGSRHPGHSNFQVGSGDLDFIKKQRKKLVNALGEEIEYAGSKTVLFSSELVHSRLSCMEHIKEFASALNALGVTNPRIVIYLREPAEAANSLYSTALRAGSRLAVPPEPGMNRYFDNICCHQSSLSRWSKVFGKDALSVRLFNKDYMEKQSVIHDFCFTAGIDPTGFIIPKPSNRSLSVLEAHLLQRLNDRIPVNKAGRPNALRADLSFFFSGAVKIPRYRMPKDLWLRYRAHYATSNEWVRKHFFPGMVDLFSEERLPVDSEAASARDLDGALLDEIACLIERIWRNKQAKINSMIES